MGDLCVVCELVRKRNKNEATTLVNGTRVCKDHLAGFVEAGSVADALKFFHDAEDELPNKTSNTTRAGLP